MHHDNDICSETKKPDLIMVYNWTKGGVDTVDQMCGNFSVSLFYGLLNMA
jgi:hypothetical protein